MTYVPFRMAGRPNCAHTKKWGFKNISKKITSIKGKKKKKKMKHRKNTQTEDETENELH